MVEIRRFRNFLCPAVLSIIAIVYVLSFGFNFSVFSDVDLKSYRNEENGQYSRFEMKEPSYKLVKRSADISYPKKASTTPEKKQKPLKIPPLATINYVKKLEIGKNSTTESNEFFPGVTLPPNASLEVDSIHHIYYNSTFYKTQQQSSAFLVDFNNLPNDSIFHHPMLSASYRRAATITLSFDFPFYGHILRNITVATGGFLYMEEYLHSWLAATQYVAPLMANFDTSLKNESVVRYFDNGTAFTVQWYKVFLQDRKEDGPFTFQVTLTKSGQIIFVYEKIPLPVTEIANDSHPVKVGISDAYTIDRIIYFIRRKTIYEYNRIDMKSDEITNYTAIVFTALPTCLSFNNCKSCMSSDIDFKCVWCEAAQRCSDGLDRYRQDWLVRNCSKNKEEISCNLSDSFYPYPAFDTETSINNTANSSSKEFTVNPVTKETASLPAVEPTWISKYKPYVIGTTISNEKAGPSSARVSDTETSINNTANSNKEFIVNPVTKETASLPAAKPTRISKYKSYVTTTTISNEKAGPSSARVGEREEISSVGVGGVIAILATFGLIIGVGIWLIYAYKYPQTPSGQFLIKYRPSQWRFRHGEARYTAASIHM